MNRISHNLGIMAGVIGVVALFGFIIWMKIDIWNECRATNSFWYCWHLVNAK